MDYVKFESNLLGKSTLPELINLFLRRF